MPLDAILDLFVGPRRGEKAEQIDDEMPDAGDLPIAPEQADAVAIALMTAQTRGLIC